MEQPGTLRGGCAYRAINNFKRLSGRVDDLRPDVPVDGGRQFRSTTFQPATTPDLLQQVLAVVYPQLGRRGESMDAVDEVAEIIACVSTMSTKAKLHGRATLSRSKETRSAVHCSDNGRHHR